MEKEKLLQELNELSKLKKIVTKSLKQAPEGRLRSELARGKYPQYYLINDTYKAKYPKGKYLKKKELAIAAKLAQKEYDRYVLDEIEKREKDIRNYISVQENSSIENAYNKLPYAKQRLVVPYILSDEAYINEWRASTISTTNPYPISNAYDTENGEIVRSKSEKIIADKLYFKGVPYKYEAALALNGKTIYPDFTVLNIKTRKTLYYEHFGMMDNPEYCKNALEKIEIYESNGIHLGEELFVTFESSLRPLSLSQLDILIEHSFIES